MIRAKTENDFFAISVSHGDCRNCGTAASRSVEAGNNFPVFMHFTSLITLPMLDTTSHGRVRGRIDIPMKGPLLAVVMAISNDLRGARDNLRDRVSLLDPEATSHESSNIVDKCPFRNMVLATGSAITC